MGESANAATVRRFYELMNARTFDEMWELFSDDATWGGGHTTAPGHPIDGMKAIMVDPMPIFVTGGIAFTLHALTDGGDRVAAEVESYAELTTGNVYNNQYHMLFRFRDGQIVQVKEYADTAHAKEVFGDLNFG